MGPGLGGHANSESSRFERVGTTLSPSQEAREPIKGINRKINTILTCGTRTLTF